MSNEYLLNEWMNEQMHTYGQVWLYRWESIIRNAQLSPKTYTQWLCFSGWSQDKLPDLNTGQVLDFRDPREPPKFTSEVLVCKITSPNYHCIWKKNVHNHLHIDLFIIPVDKMALWQEFLQGASINIQFYAVDQILDILSSISKSCFKH